MTWTDRNKWRCRRADVQTEKELATIYIRHVEAELRQVEAGIIAMENFDAALAAMQEPNDD